MLGAWLPNPEGQLLSHLQVFRCLQSTDCAIEVSLAFQHWPHLLLPQHGTCCPLGRPRSRLY